MCDGQQRTEEVPVIADSEGDGIGHDSYSYYSREIFLPRNRLAHVIGVCPVGRGSSSSWRKIARWGPVDRFRHGLQHNAARTSRLAGG
jgi:hypothetical protein